MKEYFEGLYWTVIIGALAISMLGLGLTVLGIGFEIFKTATL